MSEIHLRRLSFIELQQPQLTLWDSRHDAHPAGEDVGGDLVGLIEARKDESSGI